MNTQLNPLANPFQFDALDVRTATDENGEVIFINEAGLYRLIFRSQKPNAEAFATWICETVLPSIRRNGFFGVVSPKDQISIITAIDKLTSKVCESRNVFEIQTLVPQLKTLHNMIGSTMPELSLVKANIEQSDLLGLWAGVK
jgi:prophage antirepressor-like protein